MQELKGLLQYLVPLALLVAVAILQGYFRRSARGSQGEALGVPPVEPAPERFHPAPRSEVSSTEGRPELPREPEASRGPQRRDLVPDPSPDEREPVASGTGLRLRRLLAHSQGRRVALLVHEVFRPPDGCGRDDARRRLG